MDIPEWLQQAGGHERPWWLKTNIEAGRAPKGYGRYELPYPSTLDFTAIIKNEEGVKPTGAAAERARLRRRLRNPNPDPICEPSPMPKADISLASRTAPPPTPATHMRALAAKVTRPIETNGCDEYDRCFYFPPCTLQTKPGRTVHEANCRGPEAKEGLGKRSKVWGALESDYGKAGKAVEKGWNVDKLKRVASEPAFGDRPHMVNPSMVSHNVTTCMVGGTNISLKHSFPKKMHRAEKRQVGLYEESFENWRGNYKLPIHGLAQSDVTEFAGEMIQQKALIRK
mmetsp:Transcript_39102/g.84449  ORF Transcript_39102/g.84449 Transcript_39102/m.84449 type:complete len:284 (+) Transcript_39102:144-995(+)